MNRLVSSLVRPTLIFTSLLALTIANTQAAAVPVKVVKSGSTFSLTRGGKPYFAKGGGGGGSKELLAKSGGNSFRTWGFGAETQGDLDQAEKLGLTVAVGVWLPHKANWSDAGMVEGLKSKVRDMVTTYKDHPAVLCWSIGNEMEGDGKDGPDLWKAVNELAKICKELDPNHPTMSVVAEIGGQKLENIKKYCPDLDIVGVNTYAGGPSMGDRYKKANVGKPYMVTEYGPPGTWEMGRNNIGTPDELTSTEKAAKYEETYKKSIFPGGRGICVGSYAFTWGFKREATATWYGMLLPDDKTKLAAVDTMTELWSGKKPQFLCPKISPIKLAGSNTPKGGTTLKASVIITDSQDPKPVINWTMNKEMTNYGVTGTGEKATDDHSTGIVKNGEKQVEINLPTETGIYRIYCYVTNKNASAALASIAIKVE